MKKVLKIKNGKIIIETKNIKEDKLVREAIKSNESLNIKNESKKNPCIIITGIETGYNKDEFINELLKENKDLANLIKNQKGYIKVITTKKCRDIRKENWILETDVHSFKFIVKQKGKLKFDLILRHVDEYNELPICYNCSRIGHIAKYCKNEKRCMLCGEKHEHKNCNLVKPDCPNCKERGIIKSLRDHSANSKDCNTYINKINLMKKTRINYLNDGK